MKTVDPLVSLITDKIVNVVCPASDLIPPVVNRSLPIGERPTVITVNGGIRACEQADIAFVSNPDSFKLSKQFLNTQLITVTGPRVLSRITANSNRPYTDDELRQLISTSIDYLDLTGKQTISSQDDSLVLVLRLLKKYGPAEVRLYGVEYSATSPNLASHFFSFSPKGYVCQSCYKVAAKPYMYEGTLHTCPACHVIGKMSFFSFRGGGHLTTEKLASLKDALSTKTKYFRYSGKPSKLDKLFKRVNV